MVELSPWARLLFIALLNFVDDEGLIEYKPKRIKMQVFPADSVSVQGELDALIESSRLEVVSSDHPDVRQEHQQWTAQTRSPSACFGTRQTPLPGGRKGEGPAMCCTVAGPV